MLLNLRPQTVITLMICLGFRETQQRENWAISELKNTRSDTCLQHVHLFSLWIIRDKEKIWNYKYDKWWGMQHIYFFKCWSFKVISCTTPFIGQLIVNQLCNPLAASPSQVWGWNWFESEAVYPGDNHYSYRYSTY